VVFPGLGEAELADTAEFVSDELDPEALREVRMTARRMERQRERLEAMSLEPEEKPPAEERDEASAEEKKAKASERRAREKAEDTRSTPEVQKPVPENAREAAEETASGANESSSAANEDESSSASTSEGSRDESSDESSTKTKGASDASARPQKPSSQKNESSYESPYDDYQSSPYANDPYGDGSDESDGSIGSLMDILASLNGGGDSREEVHAPAATVDAQTAELLKRVSPDKAPDTSGKGELEMGYLRYPNLVGKTVTFVSEGNIWVGSADGGPAARVSASYSVEALPKLSPDGKTIAFLAQSVDGYEVFTVPVAGGVTTRVSYGSAAVKLEGWTKEGKILVVTSFFSPVGLPQLAAVNPATKNMEVLPFARATGGTQDEQGCYVFYPLRQTSSTKRYEGGEQSRLWRWCDGDDEAKLLTDEAWTKRGAWAPATTPAFPWTVFFLSDKDGVANVWSMKLDGSEKTQITHECGMDIMEFDLDVTADENGDVVGVARVGGSLKKFKVGRSAGANGRDGPMALMGDRLLTTIPITLVSEFRESAVQKLRFPLEELREVALSDDGMYAALVIRGQIFFTPLLEQLGSRIEQVTGFDGAVRYRHAQFVRSEHPEDTTKILAMSDASGEYEYVLLERLSGAETGGLWNETQLTSGGGIKGVMSYSTVSPDSTSLVFDDTYGSISVLNLSSTAVNTFDFKTTPDDEETGSRCDGGPDGNVGAAHVGRRPRRARGTRRRRHWRREGDAARAHARRRRDRPTGTHRVFRKGNFRQKRRGGRLEAVSRARALEAPPQATRVQTRVSLAVPARLAAGARAASRVERAIAFVLLAARFFVRRVRGGRDGSRRRPPRARHAPHALRAAPKRRRLLGPLRRAFGRRRSGADF
jgi:hypothetical protein